MKRFLTTLSALMVVLPVLAQEKKLTLFEYANHWDDRYEYKFNSQDKEHYFDGLIDRYAMLLSDNPMMDALSAQFTGDSENIDIPVAEFKLDDRNNYVKIRLKSEKLAEMEGRLWILPDGKQWFVVKMVNYEEDSLPRIFFFKVDSAKGELIPASSPDGLRYGFIENFLLPRSGREIEVKFENQPSDKMVLEDDGTFVYKAYAPYAFACYVNDPDPSGITNVRNAPGGKIILRIGEETEAADSQDGDWPDDGGICILDVFNPKNGWWQILGYYVDGKEIKGQAWIHYSVLEMSTRNYNGQSLNLYQEPSADAPVVGTITEEAASVRPMDMSEDGEWMKVKSASGTGWIETEWLCGNPYTNCS